MPIQSKDTCEIASNAQGQWRANACINTRCCAEGRQAPCTLVLAAGHPTPAGIGARTKRVVHPQMGVCYVSGRGRRRNTGFHSGVIPSLYYLPSSARPIGLAGRALRTW